MKSVNEKTMIAQTYITFYTNNYTISPLETFLTQIEL